MLNYIYMFLALVVGTLCGMGGMLLLVSGSSPIQKRKEKHKKKKRIKKPKTQPKTEEPEVSEGLLTKKMPPKDFSVTDFNCAADGYDSDDHIAGRQRQQDNAYNSLKSRKSDK